MDTDEMLREFPMLYPAEGTRYPRQKFRESIMTVPGFRPTGKRARVIISVRAQAQQESRSWTAITTPKNGPHDPPSDWRRRQVDYGLVTWELTAVNGVPLAESDLRPIGSPG